MSSERSDIEFRRVRGETKSTLEDPKSAVQSFWDAQACGEIYAEGETIEEQFAAQANARYTIEPYIQTVAKFDGDGKRILEIGIGMGADHVEWARSKPELLVGIDITPRAVEIVRERMALESQVPRLAVGDAENLAFPDNTFDIIYSWGVLHHSPDTKSAFAECHRVLKPGGELRAMVYHRPSIVGIMLWSRYGLAAGRLGRSMADIYANHLESPGTKGYSVDEAKSLVSDFSSATVRPIVTFGDLLEGEVGHRHGSRSLSIARKFWPRPIIRKMPFLGLDLLIEAQK